METILLDILNQLRAADDFDAERLAKLIRVHSKNIVDNRQHHSKKKLLPFYLKVKDAEPERWASWDIDPALEKRLLALLQVKPRRTASGVATITVITKPWPCASDCLYCPNDLRMPKSYLSDEPACQRAELNYFDPYLQVASRLYVLTQMGHLTDKIELIVLGGTWSDYPAAYQTWFVAELFRALNDGSERERNAAARRDFYVGRGLSNRKTDLLAFTGERQQEVNDGSLTYNQGVEQLYGSGSIWGGIAAEQVASFDELTKQHQINETAEQRVVGLVIETRPDTVTAGNLTILRRLGCTKIQMGIQSLDSELLKLNQRNISPAKIREAFELLRVFGFKIHAHFMLNLYGAVPNADKQDYLSFVSDEHYIPDEVKLYPCALVKGAKLCERYADKTWRPYSEEELVDVLVADTLNTPPFIRISRMIRDISAHDIMVGNKKTNLRQMVERQAQIRGGQIQEIRHREISTSKTDVDILTLETLGYRTTVTNEYFLQWITLENKIAGFLRLSLPDRDFVAQHQSALPIEPGEAMIREVHVYGKVAGLRGAELQVDGAQHLGLGKQLIEAAVKLAKTQGYNKLNVISSVGTREYYRGLGFKDNDLYQQIEI